MTHLDLFSGIGGFALAARWMNWETVQFVELDKFCQKVLQKNFPNVPIHDDIKTFDGTKFRGAIDIVTGGFPCQPFSTAGKRKGKADDRYLWPEMLRVITEVRPAFIVAENVPGIETLFQYEMQSEMEGKIYASEAEANADLSGIRERTGTAILYMAVEDLIGVGYTVETFIIPACAVNAPHRRDRVWIVAHTQSNNDRRTEREFHQKDGRQDGQMLSASVSASDGLCEDWSSGHPDSESTGRYNTRESEGIGVDLERNVMDSAGRNEGTDNAESSGCDVADSGRLPKRRRSGCIQKESRSASGEFDWQDFPTQPPLRVGNDGLSSNMVRSAIRGAGNAIVPQIAFEIFKAIEQVR